MTVAYADAHGAFSTLAAPRSPMEPMAESSAFAFWPGVVGPLVTP